MAALLVVADYTAHEFAEVVIKDGPSFEVLRQSLADAGRKRLDEVLARNVVSGRPVECLAAVGDDRHRQILDHAARLHCDLIVLASHGRGVLESALLGRQTVQVIAGSPIPVLVAK